ncbi:hypothetical protein GE09DRAFT_1053471 [Coniochaeta sp. 2T2.1]|nr:hypothetical protein GE09DRAFT_1053471 [Coniochaeta sp. 2T2.1]
MDPSFHEAKMKHKMPKAPESTVHKKAKWRRQLDRNPWAHALATDIRRCPATQTPIPRYFLQDFNLVSHPETGKAWYVPSSLAPRTPRSPPPVQQPADSAAPSIAEQKSDSATTNLNQVQTFQSQPQPVTQHRKSTNATKPTSYMLAREDLITVQNSKRPSAHSSDWKKLLVLNHSLPKFHSVQKVWREDMGGLVLELMRRRTVEELVYYAKLSEDTSRNAYIVRCKTWEDIKKPEYNGHRGCVLWFSSDGEDWEGPGPRAIMDVPGVRFGGKIPVHNMNRLMGDEHSERLRRETEIFGKGSLFMVVRARTMEVQLKLWKLQGYLAYPVERLSLETAKKENRRGKKGREQVDEEDGEE